MRNLKNQPVLILGLGASGLAMARWCARCGAQVTVVDTRSEPPALSTLREQLPQVTFVCAELSAALVEATSIRAVFKSPGLSPEAVAPVWNAAKAMGLWTGGELSLFAAALKDLNDDQAYESKVLAITGTNGKTTVTSLTGQLVERSGKSVAVAGNIGPTLLDTLADRIYQCTLPEVWVLELSSFQLDGVAGFEPTAATVLNITQDHLDWHGNMQAYAQAKAAVFGSQGLMILNREDAAVIAMAPTAEEIKKKLKPARNVLTFGGDMPLRPGDFGIEVLNGMAWLVRAHEADETRRVKKRGSVAEEDEIHIQRLMPADALRIRGRHNAVNALAALALSSAAGCALGPVLYALRDYRGEPHRVEPVAIINDVEYFDDSKGTNVGATVAALKGLGAERRVVVILGGEGKGQDFSPLAEPVSQFVRAVVLIGRDAPLIREALALSNISLMDAGSMLEAVQLAAGRANPGDAVLMSPACASFDMFKNYEHRAEVFRAAVQSVGEEAGVEVSTGAPT